MLVCDIRQYFWWQQLCNLCTGTLCELMCPSDDVYFNYLYDWRCALLYLFVVVAYSSSPSAYCSQSGNFFSVYVYVMLNFLGYVYS